MYSVAETIPVDELKRKAQPIVSQHPKIESDVTTISALVLGEKYLEDVIAYLVEVRTDDVKKHLSDIEKFKGIYSCFNAKPSKIELVDYSHIGKSSKETPFSVGSEDYDDSETRKRLAKMIGLKEVPPRDPEAIKRLKGKIKSKDIGETFDSIEEIRSVRESWTDNH